MSESVMLHLHAAAREAAGQSTLSCTATTAHALRADLVSRFGEQMQLVLAVSTLLVDGAGVRPGEDIAIPDGSTVEVLPPFAGG
jgi:molybdopterin converting factor small subunit